MQSDRAAVLVVNANPGLQMLLDALLGGEYTLELAADTTAGLARLADGSIDLVLLALTLPRLDGLSFCDAVRSRPRGARLPILALTPATSLAQRRAIFAAGATDHFMIPLDLEDLRCCVGVWTRTHRLLRTFYQRLLDQLEQIPVPYFVDETAADPELTPFPSAPPIPVHQLTR